MMGAFMRKNSWHRKTAAALVCTTLMTSLLIWPVLAEDEDLNNQLNTVQQQMQVESTKKAKAEATIGSVSQQLHQIENQLETATSQLKEAQKQRGLAEQDIAKNTKLLKEAQVKLDKREKIFLKRARDIYINGRLSYLDVILGAKNFSDFANRVEMLKRILDSDIKLIKEIQAEKQEITTRQEALEAAKAKRVKVEKEAKEKQIVIAQKKAERNAVLQKAMTDKAAAEQAQRELEASSANIKAMLQQRAAARAAQASAASSGGGSYVQGSGQLSWPANGPVTSPFGWREHPIFGRQILHSGIDIGVPEGTPVHAADSGTVVDAGWIDGYGNCVIIDHGNGISTLYGHNSEIAVSAGQSVSKGQVIAYAGMTGNATGPHIHFEVRVNGDPVDPMGYL